LETGLSPAFLSPAVYANSGSHFYAAGMQPG
jgi:hypothetical protein